MERKPLNPNVKQAIDGITEDFRQALINEANKVAVFSNSDEINFMCLDTALKTVPAILKMCVEVVTVGAFGEQQGILLNQAFDIRADTRITRAMAQDIIDTMGDQMPAETRKMIDDILNKLDGRDSGETS